MTRPQELAVPIETPERIVDINVVLLAEDLGGPVGVISSVEGTTQAHGERLIRPDVMDWISDGYGSGALGAMMLETDRSGDVGRDLCSSLGRQLHKLRREYHGGDLNFRNTIHPGENAFRKPSGNMGRVMLNNLGFIDIPAKRAVFVGDKLADMQEANVLHLERNLYMGFMVARLGSKSHLFDINISNRRSDKFREQLMLNTPNQKYVLAKSTTSL